MADCRAFYGFDESYFAQRNCANTAAEIAGQPALWRALSEALRAKKQEIADFMGGLRDSGGLGDQGGLGSLGGLGDQGGSGGLGSLGVPGSLRDPGSLGDPSGLGGLGNPPNLRIVLTGAGSSAFVGEALACFAASASGIKCEAVHTTDIVSAPDATLFDDIPTLLISFARSGNSPESAGAVQYARKRIKRLYEAAIICDGASSLSKITAESDKSFVLLMPDGSNDKGFAMTASFTCMLLAGFAMLNYGKIDEIADDICTLSDTVESGATKMSEIAMQLAQKPFDRAVYLACGAYKGLAHEGSLKMMELTNGGVNASFDSATGFRHGPKTVIKDKTLSLHFISNNRFTANYDLDLLREMSGEKKGNIIAALYTGHTDPHKYPDSPGHPDSPGCPDSPGSNGTPERTAPPIHPYSPGSNGTPWRTDSPIHPDSPGCPDSPVHPVSSGRPDSPVHTDSPGYSSDLAADFAYNIKSGGYGVAADICAGINGIVFFQMLAMHKSLSLGINTDNPSAGGQVNRVVKGVRIYPLPS